MMSYRKMGRKGIGMVLLIVGLVGMLAILSGVVPAPWHQDYATVEITNETGEHVAIIDVEVADTPIERHRGLSNHDSLDENHGMLFVHAFERDRTYVMRDMDFDIDIIFIGADGKITTIRHARAPSAGEDGEDLRYEGTGKWVLEVPHGSDNANGIEEGDTVYIRDN